MDLENIRLLLKVVELGSVQGAARQLGVSRTMMRRRLADLEAELGCRLLSATASGVTLTPAGAVVAEQGRGLLERSARMRVDVAAANESPEGVLRVILPAGLPDVVHIALVRALYQTNPGLRVHETEAADPQALLREAFDLMFHFGPPPTHGEWFSRIIKRLPLVPVASEAYFAQRGRPESPEDLAHHAIIGWRRPGADPLAWPLRAGGAVPVQPIVVSDNAQFVHRAAQEGLGILLGAPDLAFLAGPTALLPTLEAAIGAEESVRVLSHRPESADPRARALLEGVLQFIRDMSDGTAGG